MRKMLTALAIVAGALPALAHSQEFELPPPYAGVYQPQGVDEIGLWREDDESERRLAQSSMVIRDEALNTYVKQVLCETVGADRCESVRIYILRVPIFNASMSPNGTMRVFSGLLLRARNEAELAFVLGHEFGHFERRHTLEDFRRRRSSSDLLAWSALLTYMAPGNANYSNFQALEFSVIGDLFRHGRDSEREADRLGVAYLNGSKLAPRAGVIIWRNLMGEIEATAAARGLRRPDFRRVAFTASHPPEGERFTTLTALAADDAGRDTGAERYREALGPWIPLFLEDQIKLNDFGGSDFLIETLAETGWTADLWYARGELYRTRGAQRDLVNATQFYREAIALNPSHAAAHRGLGLSLIKTGQQTEGRSALREYLRLSPDATDGGMIRLMIPGESEQ